MKATVVEETLSEFEPQIRNAWLCRFGWHAWSKWVMGECTTTSVFYKGERAGLCQARKCERCGKNQVETI